MAINGKGSVMTVVNPVLQPTALLRVQMPAVYNRAQVYDPTWNDPSYGSTPGQKIVPAVGSLVRDVDGTGLWVTAIDPVTLYPSYLAMSSDNQNDNVVSLINFGNSQFRLYGDYRAAPYPVTPDSKCIFIGKSPRLYTLSRYPGTAKETIISKYYDATGKLVSEKIPLRALDTTNTSWYLPRTNITDVLDDNEEILAKIYDESGVEVQNVRLFAKQSSIINENVIYSPTIVGMTVSGNQQLADGTFFLYEKQSFTSLGLRVSLIYDDGSQQQTTIDNVKCFLYGESDFISSFSGLRQYATVKYFRSQNEAISPSVADKTGQMISVKIPITVVPNTLGTTVKIMPLPLYNASIAQYVMRYYMYFGDGRSFVDVSGYVNIANGKTLVKDASYFGVQQTVTLTVDMSKVDPTNYPTSALYQQTMVIQFGPPNMPVRWTIKDAATSPYTYGQDNSSSRRPSIRFDASRSQYFIPSFIFGNTAAFINSFYTQSAPPYDPTVAQIPQQPTHFLLRDIVTGAMIVTAPIPIANYTAPFNILGDAGGQYVGSAVVVEFLNIINTNTRNVLFGVPVDVTAGTYIAS